MNVYDFDGTIYNGDSTLDFYIFSLKKKPSIIHHLPKQICGFILYFLKRIDKTRMKENFYIFLKDIDYKIYVELFWDNHQKKIYEWYHKTQHVDDIIISASPEFLLKPICSRLGIKYLIASRVNPQNGLYTGLNCYGHEKVIRLENEYSIKHIDNFYSDSTSDLPLAKIADKAYLIEKGNIIDWTIE